MKIKKKILSAVLSAVLMGAVISPAAVSLTEANYSYAEAAVVVSAPTANKKSGTYTLSANNMKVTLSAATGAKIYYSLNGGAYRLYSSAGVTITKNSTLKAYAVKNSSKSSVVTYTYKLAPSFTVTPSAGTYTSAKTAKITTKVSGVKFYYTTDGKAPTTSSKVYTSAGIKISETAKLRILAVKTGWNSKSLTRSYTISASGTGTGTSAQTFTNILADYKSKWAYNSISAREKKVYERLYAAAEKNSRSVNLRDLGATINELNNAFWACDYDNPQFFNIDTGYSYEYSGNQVWSVDIIYRLNSSQYKSTLSNIESKTASVIKETKTLKNDYERVKLFHDWIINRTDYTLSGSSYIHEVDGPVIYGKALCEGYARTFSYLCQSVGIQCVCLRGFVDGESHMWNKVKIDGKWYNIDVTFDDPVSSTGAKLLKYDYYLLTDSQITRKSHKFGNYFTLPTASTTYTKS